MSDKTPSSTAHRVTSLRRPLPPASRTRSCTRALSPGRYSVSNGFTSTARRFTSGVTRSSVYPTRNVGRPGSAIPPGGALRPRTRTIETKTFGAYASGILNLSEVAPPLTRMRRCSIRPSRSTVIHASASVNGDATRIVAVSPTE